MPKPLAVLLLLTLVAPTSGCFTFKSLGEPEAPKVYGGVRRHVRVQRELDPQHQRMGAAYAVFALDVVPCALCDTLFLPATVFMTPEKRGRSRGDDSVHERRKRREETEQMYEKEFEDDSF